MAGNILLFNVNFMKLGQIQNLATIHGLAVTNVPSVDFGKKMGELAGIPGFPKSNASSAVIDGEMMVFCNMEQPVLEKFLDAYHGAGIADIPHKAMLTPFNAQWTAAALSKELSQEHAEMHRK